MNLRDALNRTLLLMRDEVHDYVTDDALLSALTETTVVILADRANIGSHAAQTALVTSAMLMARSGHRVHLCAPNIPLAGAQPPLGEGRIIERLIDVGRDMLPGVEFSIGLPRTETDLAIALGSTPFQGGARRRVRLNASTWSGALKAENDTADWIEQNWPIGAMGAAAAVSGEAFKVSMRKLGAFFRNPERLASTFAPVGEISFDLAPARTPKSTNLGRFDCISGGAINNALLFALTRLPGVHGDSRVVEPDVSDATNLNRNMLLLRSRLKQSKARDLAEICSPLLRIIPVERRYNRAMAQEIGLAPSVLVGVDHIPSRWEVQRARPEWLGIGATTHWSAMVSFHALRTGCAECLHPYDDPGDAPIPTVAFVSFWAGLLLATFFVRHMANDQISEREQQTYLTALRPENPSWGPVAVRQGCPTCGDAGASPFRPLAA